MISHTTLRHAKWYQNMMVKNEEVEPAALPPTERATHYHSLRVHLEMMRVTRLDIDCGLDPRNWGWQTVDGVLRPIKTDLPPAPEFLLTVISCSCKTTSRNT